jgi:hypothetical protein
VKKNAPCKNPHSAAKRGRAFAHAAINIATQNHGPIGKCLEGNAATRINPEAIATASRKILCLTGAAPAEGPRFFAFAISA